MMALYRQDAERRKMLVDVEDARASQAAEAGKREVDALYAEEREAARLGVQALLGGPQLSAKEESLQKLKASLRNFRTKVYTGKENP